MTRVAWRSSWAFPDDLDLRKGDSAPRAAEVDDGPGFGCCVKGIAMEIAKAPSSSRKLEVQRTDHASEQCQAVIRQASPP